MSASIITLNGKTPRVAEGTFVAPSAVLIGDVEIAEDASVWYHTVLDGRAAPIRIGARTNVQDQSRLITQSGGGAILVGADVLIGHTVSMHATKGDCVLEDEAFVGINAHVDSAVICSKSIVAACAEVRPGARVESGQMWGGAPAKLLRELRPGEDMWAKAGAGHYVHEAATHRAALQDID